MKRPKKFYLLKMLIIIYKTEYSFSLLKTISYSLNSYYEVKIHLNQLCQNMSDTFSPFWRYNMTIGEPRARLYVFSMECLCNEKNHYSIVTRSYFYAYVCMWILLARNLFHFIIFFIQWQIVTYFRPSNVIISPRSDIVISITE